MSWALNMLNQPESMQFNTRMRKIRDQLTRDQDRYSPEWK